MTMQAEDDFTGLGFGGSDGDVLLLTDYGLQVAKNPSQWPAQLNTGDGGTTYRVLLQLAQASGDTPGQPIPMEALSYGKYPINPLHVETAVGRLVDLGMAQRAELGQAG